MKNPLSPEMTRNLNAYVVVSAVAIGAAACGGDPSQTEIANSTYNRTLPCFRAIFRANTDRAREAGCFGLKFVGGIDSQGDMEGSVRALQHGDHPADMRVATTCIAAWYSDALTDVQIKKGKGLLRSATDWRTRKIALGGAPGYTDLHNPFTAKLSDLCVKSLTAKIKSGHAHQIVMPILTTHSSR